MLYFLYFLLVLTLLFIIIFTSYQIYTKFFQPGAFYYPTIPTDVKKMMKIVKISDKDTLVDIGSGDGRILIAAAKLGANAIGYEINPFLVVKSRKLIKNLNLDKQIKIYWKSFWKADYSKATIITVYLFPSFMDRLQKLLEKKSKKKLKVIVNNYPFTKLKEDKKIGQIYLYTLNKK